MSRKNSLDKALGKYDKKARMLLAERILKISEETPVTPALRTHLHSLKIVCGTALFICGPITGWLYNEWSKGSITLPMFGVFVIPLIFIGIITAIILLLIKIPSE